MLYQAREPRARGHGECEDVSLVHAGPEHDTAEVLGRGGLGAEDEDGEGEAGVVEQHLRGLAAEEHRPSAHRDSDLLQKVGNRGRWPFTLGWIALNIITFHIFTLI